MQFDLYAGSSNRMHFAPEKKRINDNPFEPDETIEQADARVGRMIRDNVDRRDQARREFDQAAIDLAKHALECGFYMARADTVLAAGITLGLIPEEEDRKP